MRIARLHIPGVVHHLIWRFVDREWFFREDDERDRYRSLLGRCLEDTDWRCISYALMSSHIHIAAIGGEEPLAVWSRRVNSPFARWMNERRRRLGPLFADRAKSYAISPTSVGTLISYIHDNPVRAGVVAAAEDSTWTSGRAYAGLVAAPRWLFIEEGLARAGVQRFNELPTAPTRSELVEVKIKEVSAAARRRGAVNVATPETHVVPLVARAYARVRPDPFRVIQLVAEIVALAPTEISSRRRNAITCRAREMAVHVARMVGVTGSEIAAALGISHQAVSKIARYTQAESRCELICARLLQEVRFAS
jgi:REP element-mobilizing transposase RayT/DNA-binding CsgD family transcriptional regulator